MVYAVTPVEQSSSGGRRWMVIDNYYAWNVQTDYNSQIQQKNDGIVLIKDLITKRI